MHRDVEAELLHHSQSLRTLARALVGDQHADDLLQDVALQALQRGPARPGPMRAWLASIARHFAGKHRRAAHNRARFEPRAEPPEPDWTPDRLAEQQESIDRLHAAFRALPEPCRGALQLRFFEGLTPTEIASATGVPLATVKSRLQRGLGLLRERLDAEGRGDWRALFTVAFGLRSGAIGATASLGAGALLMGTGVKLAFASAAVAIAAAAALFFQAGHQPPTARGGDPGRASPSPFASVAPPPAADAVTPERREVIAVPTGVESRLVDIRGRCVDTTGDPMPGVVASLELRIPDTQANWQPPTPVEADADGRFVLQCPVPQTPWIQLHLQPQDHCAAVAPLPRLAAGEPLDLGDLVLHPGCRVQGRIVDARGQPVAGAVLQLQHNSFAGPWCVLDDVAHDTVTSRADGTFGPSRTLPAGPAFVRSANVLLPDERVAFALDLQQPLLQLDLTIADPDTVPAIRGHVVAADGAPVAGAQIATGMHRAHSASDGAFTLFLRGRDAASPSCKLVVTADGYENLFGFPATIGTHDLRIELQPKATLVVHARTLTGEPVPEFLAAIVSSTASGYHTDGSPLARGHTGEATLRGLSVGERSLWVLPTGGDAAAPPLQALTLRAHGEVTVTLPPARSRMLRLLDAHGSPLPGAEVEMIDACGAGLPITGNVFDATRWRVLIGGTRAFLLQRGRTDASGTLLLRGPGERELALRIHGSDLAPQVVQPVRLDVDAPLAVTAIAGATWSGCLRPADVAGDLQPAHSVAPQDAPNDRSLGLMLRQGRLQLFGVLDALLPIGRDGTFHFTELPPGTWSITLVHESVEFPLGDVTLQAGRELHQDLDVSALRRSNVDLQVFVDGAVFANGSVSIEGRYPIGAGEPVWGHETLRTDTHGRVHSRTMAGLLAVSLWLDDDHGGYSELPVAEPLTVTAGADLQRVLDLHLQRPSLRVLQPDGSPAVGVQLLFQNATGRCAAAAATDAEGRAQAPRLSAGTFVVLAKRDDVTLAAFRKLHGRDSGKEIEFAVTIPADAPGTLDIRLPATWEY